MHRVSWTEVTDVHLACRAARGSSREAGSDLSRTASKKTLPRHAAFVSVGRWLRETATRLRTQTNYRGWRGHTRSCWGVMSTPAAVALPMTWVWATLPCWKCFVRSSVDDFTSRGGSTCSGASNGCGGVDRQGTDQGILRVDGPWAFVAIFTKPRR